jgi:hypothetical protein
MDVNLNNGNVILNDTIPALVSDYKVGQNILLNDTKTREFHMIINGKDKPAPGTERTIKLKGYRCEGRCGLEKLNQTVIEEVDEEIVIPPLFWSLNTTWPSGKVPVAGDDVNIMTNMSVIFDLAESPIFKLIYVNGKLTFKEDQDCHLKAKHIFIRAGKFLIGNETHPFEHKATITLMGEKESETMVYDNAIEAGNKVIANIGTVKMYGKPRTKTLTRLHKEA